MSCLDTNVLLDLIGRNGEPNRRAAKEKVRRLREHLEPLTTTRFNVAELLYGAELSNNPGNAQKQVYEMITGLVILEFTEQSMVLFARIAARQRRIGKPVGPIDSLIAAVAVAHGQSVLTRNVKHFQLIPGLQVDTY